MICYDRIYGLIIYDTIWYVMIYGMIMIWYGMLWYMVWLWYDIIYDMVWYDMIYLLTAIGLTPAGSSTVHIYTQTILVHRTTQWNRMPRTEHT